MSLTMEFSSIRSPISSSSLNRSRFSSPSVALALPPSSSSFLKFESSLVPKGFRLSIDATPRGLGLGLCSEQRKCSLKRPIMAFAASHEDSHSEIEVEKDNDDIKLGAEESQEAWKQTLESFKVQAEKMKSVSQEAYEVYTKKTMVILKEISEQSKIQTDEAMHDLTELAKELRIDGKEYLSMAAEKSPRPVKEIVKSFSSSTDDVNAISEVRDFHVGIPYGFLLSHGGFLYFMFTGSIYALRFGVILGGVLLAFSVKSLKSYEKGETDTLALKGQAAIVAIFFLRDIVVLFRRASLFTFLTTIISGSLTRFYLYKIRDYEQSKGSDLGQAEN